MTEQDVERIVSRFYAYEGQKPNVVAMEPSDHESVLDLRYPIRGGLVNRLHLGRIPVIADPSVPHGEVQLRDATGAVLATLSAVA